MKLIHYFGYACKLAGAASMINFLLIAAVYAQASVDAPDAWNSLQKSAAAARLLSYQGIFVYEACNKTKAVQITHLYNGHGEYSRNVTLDNSSREVFSQGNDLVIFNPKKEKIIIEKRHGQNLFPAILPVQLAPLKTSYTLYTGEVEQVAGRSAKVLLLTPKDNLRYQYKFWIDQEYGLLLKYSMLNTKQEPLETVAFNQINMMDSLNLEWFQPQINANKLYEMEDEMPVESDHSVSNDWSIKQLPMGFNKVEQMRLMVHGKTTPVTQFIISDGMATVSLFIEPLNKNAKPRVGYHVVGNNSFYANVEKGYQIIVVGEVPQETVTKIANAVVFKK